MLSKPSMACTVLSWGSRKDNELMLWPFIPRMRRPKQMTVYNSSLRCRQMWSCKSSLPVCPLRAKYSCWLDQQILREIMASGVGILSSILPMLLVSTVFWTVSRLPWDFVLPPSGTWCKHWDAALGKAEELFPVSCPVLYSVCSSSISLLEISSTRLCLLQHSCCKGFQFLLLLQGRGAFCSVAITGNEKQAAQQETNRKAD